jgi:hypothetical protein
MRYGHVTELNARSGLCILCNILKICKTFRGVVKKVVNLYLMILYLVMRTQGSLRVILNTKIWPGMTIERASNKSVRITATDGADGIKVFLIMVSYCNCQSVPHNGKSL